MLALTRPARPYRCDITTIILSTVTINGELPTANPALKDGVCAVSVVFGYHVFQHLVDAG